MDGEQRYANSMVPHQCPTGIFPPARRDIQTSRPISSVSGLMGVAVTCHLPDNYRARLTSLLARPSPDGLRAWVRDDAAKNVDLFDGISAVLALRQEISLQLGVAVVAISVQRNQPSCCESRDALADGVDRRRIISPMLLVVDNLLQRCTRTQLMIQNNTCRSARESSNSCAIV